MESIESILRNFFEIQTKKHIYDGVNLTINIHKLSGMSDELILTESTESTETTETNNLIETNGKYHFSYLIFSSDKLSIIFVTNLKPYQFYENREGKIEGVGRKNDLFYNFCKDKITSTKVKFDIVIGSSIGECKKYLFELSPKKYFIFDEGSMSTKNPVLEKFILSKLSLSDDIKYRINFHSNSNDSNQSITSSDIQTYDKIHLQLINNNFKMVCLKSTENSFLTMIVLQPMRILEIDEIIIYVAIGNAKNNLRLLHHLDIKPFNLFGRELDFNLEIDFSEETRQTYGDSDGIDTNALLFKPSKYTKQSSLIKNYVPDLSYDQIVKLYEEVKSSEHFDLIDQIYLSKFYFDLDDNGNYLDFPFGYEIVQYNHSEYYIIMASYHYRRGICTCHSSELEHRVLYVSENFYDIKRDILSSIGDFFSDEHSYKGDRIKEKLIDLVANQLE